MTEISQQKTETLLQKLEEKMMQMFSEIEDSRREIQRLNHENSLMRIERETHAKKLSDLISLLDTVNIADSFTPSMNTPMLKPVLVQG